MERDALILRRLLLLSLVAYCASLLGCTTPGVMCDMKTDYASESAVPPQGKVLIAWRFNAEQYARSNGYAECMASDAGKLCVVRMKGPPPSFSDVCGLAKLGHELRHSMEDPISPGHN